MTDTKKQQTPTQQEQFTAKEETKTKNAGAKVLEEIQVQAPQGYQFIKTIGDGSFGKVKLGVHKLTEQKVAIKILCKDRIRQRTDIERISRQIKIMKLVRHPFIVQMYEIIESPKYLFLVMEYISGGDLFDQISNSSKLSEERCKKIFSQIILGLQYLHGIGITHRDMKPQNILMESSGIIKIADFGLGNFFSGDQKLKTACGSPCYAPPQMLNQQEYNPRKVDIWSSGIILYAMVHGYLPFEDDVTTILYQKIKTKNVRVASWVSIPCRNLLRGLLAKNQNERWDIDVIKQHEFLFEEIQAEQKFVVKEVEEMNIQEFHSICDHLGIIEEQRLLGNLKKNKHNNLTTLYYLGKKKYYRQMEKVEAAPKQQSSSEVIPYKPPQLPVKAVHQQNRQLFSFCQKAEASPIIQSKQQKHEQIFQKQEQPKIQKVQARQEDKATESPSLDLRQSIIQPREPPNQIPQAPKPYEPIIENMSDSVKIKKQVVEQGTKDNKSQKPPTKSLHSPPTRKQATQLPKKVEKKEQKIIKNQNKGLKKSERMPIYKPKQETNKFNDSQVKLYERSHSKDRPIILKNNLKTQPSAGKNHQQGGSGTVVGKVVHIEPHLLDVDRIVFCSGDRFCQILQKKGFNGRIQYFSYQKEAIFLAKASLKLNKNAKGIIGNAPSLQKIVSQINQSI